MSKEETPRELIQKICAYQAAIQEGRGIRPWGWCDYTFDAERLKEEVQRMREQLLQQRGSIR